MKRPRKVALISVFDYPRELYSAYWLIDVKGSDEEGYVWASHLFSYEPLGWEWQGKVTPERPDMPWPEYPVAPSPTLPPRPRPGASAKVLAAYAAQVHAINMRPENVAAAEAFRAKCAEIYEANPKPVYLIEESVANVVDSRDEADTAAQQWVLDRIGNFRRPNVAPMSDDDVEVEIAKFDAARRKGNFGEVDRIRGRLKAHGVQFTEPDKIKAAGKTAWTRKNASGKQAGHAMVLGPAGMLGEAARRLIERLFNGLSFALGYATGLRNAMMDQLTTKIDAGAGAGLWRIYDGTRPATCGTATTLLAELTMSDPSAAAAASGVWTASSITADSSANASGTATWARIVDSVATCVVDMAVGTSGSDLNLNSTSISSGQQVSITSATITEGNA